MSLTKEAFRTRVIILSLVFMPVVALAIFGLTRAFNYHELKPLGRVTDFHLKDQNGNSVTEKSFQNRVWIAGFIFTHCAEQCPQISQKMKELQKKLKSKFRVKLVSLSVDPERDNPHQLLEYGNSLGADFEKWTFLTGEKKELEDLFQNKFKINAVTGQDGGLIHSSYLVLVDGTGFIRGYYDSENPARVHQLVKDAKYLLGGLN